MARTLFLGIRNQLPILFKKKLKSRGFEGELFGAVARVHGAVEGVVRLEEGCGHGVGVVEVGKGCGGCIIHTPFSIKTVSFSCEY